MASMPASSTCASSSSVFPMRGSVPTQSFLGRKMTKLTLLVEQRLSLEALHDAYEKRGDELEQLVAKAESPEVGALVTRWFEWLESANGVSPRTRRRYATNTIYRYKESWAKLFVVLPNSRAARLTGLNKGF